MSSSRTLLNHRKGETITLFCNGKGSPEPSLQWHKDGAPLVTSGRVTVDDNQVHIVNLRRDDGGTYSCTFTNSVGEISQLIKLVVEGEWWLKMFRERRGLSAHQARLRSLLRHQTRLRRGLPGHQDRGGR